MAMEILTIFEGVTWVVMMVCLWNERRGWVLKRRLKRSNVQESLLGVVDRAWEDAPGFNVGQDLASGGGLSRAKELGTRLTILVLF